MGGQEEKMEGSGFPEQEEAFGVGRVALRKIKSPEDREQPRGRDRILSFRRRKPARAETLIHTGGGGGGLVLLSSAAFQHGVAMGGPTEVQPQILGRGMGDIPGSRGDSSLNYTKPEHLSFPTLFQLGASPIPKDFKSLKSRGRDGQRQQTWSQEGRKGCPFSAPLSSLGQGSPLSLLGCVLSCDPLLIAQPSAF